MAARRVLRGLISSYVLRLGAITLIPLVFISLLAAYLGGQQLNLRLESRFLLFFVVGAALELWLRTDLAKALIAPVGVRLNRSRLWRKLNDPNPAPIAKLVTLTVLAVMLIGTALMAAMIAFIAFLDVGFSHRVLDAVLDALVALCNNC